MRIPNIAIFHSKVLKASDPTKCWIWTGTVTPNSGYGQLSYANKQWSAHRLAYTLAKGAIPAGLLVRHSCANKLCCNPAHLSVGTYKDNADDRERDGNTARGQRTKPWLRARGDRNGGRLHPETRQGERNGRAKLTREDVIAIRAQPRDFKRMPLLAAQYGVSTSTVKQIWSGATWRHLLEPSEAPSEAAE